MSDSIRKRAKELESSLHPLSARQYVKQSFRVTRFCTSSTRCSCYSGGICIESGHIAAFFASI